MSYKGIQVYRYIYVEFNIKMAVITSEMDHKAAFTNCSINAVHLFCDVIVKQVVVQT